MTENVSTGEKQVFASSFKSPSIEIADEAQYQQHMGEDYEDDASGEETERFKPSSEEEQEEVKVHDERP